MQTQSARGSASSRALVAVVGLVSLLRATSAIAAVSPQWTPVDWDDQQTLQFRTVCPDEGEHWSYVWLVELGGDIYLRLGSRAAARVDCNETKPFVGIRIAGNEFGKVELVPVPEMADRVATAMGDKYWGDILVRFLSHPYTMKLVPASE